MPLFATLHGNDYISSCQFDLFYAKCSLPRATGIQKPIKHRHTRMKRILLWMGQNKLSLNSAIDRIASIYDVTTKDELKKCMLSSVQMYLDLETTLDEYLFGSTDDSDGNNSIISSGMIFNQPSTPSMYSIYTLYVH